MNDLKKFDRLKADITVFVGPIRDLRVTDFTSADKAAQAGRTVKSFINEVEKRRKELVAPLNIQVKTINDYAKDILAPLLAAESLIKQQLSSFETEQAKIRAEAKRREEEEARALARQAEEERRLSAEKIEAERQAQLAVLAEAEERRKRGAALFGKKIDPAALDAERRQIEEDAARKAAEEQARIDREEAERLSAAKGREWDIDQHRVKNTRQTWDYSLTDVDQVPREFLIITVNRQAVLAAARGMAAQGKKPEIPGLELFQKTSVALGDRTYIPAMALAGEEDGG